MIVSVQPQSSHWVYTAGRTLLRISPHGFLPDTKAGETALNRRRELEPHLMCDLHRPPSTVTTLSQQGPNRSVKMHHLYAFP